MWREQPTQHDIEAVEENVRRVGLVIRFRWLLVAAICVFSAIGGAIYLADPGVPKSQIASNMLIPGVTLLFVVGYNTYYHLTYRRLGNIAILNHAQLLFDVLVISVLVHYSGGVYSWFYPMYSLMVLEAAFIFPRPRDTWIVAATSALCYGGVIWLEYADILPHVEMPFVAGQLEHIAAYAAVHSLWGVTVLSGTALISLAMMDRVRSREAALEASAMLDETTGLMNRAYFHRELSAELQRARCFNRTLAVLLVDIDDFDGFNKRFGVEAGNRVLRELATLLADRTCHADSPVAELNTVCRYGGEEFGIVLQSPPSLPPEEWPGMVRAMAEGMLRDVGGMRVDDMGVTVSIGVALYPHDGVTANDLVASADQALFAAAALGGNRVSASDDAPHEEAAV